ncbi:T9SS sorting signal type C domain-containing protein [Flavobacterium gelatinilyticum]|uniref:T9SS sorting signal type C domain-containing protein n=1 Tax=Flavobacterium gelatinilyticum TaxID=3003260 RepID=UPI00248107FC|nr:T9SS sorting signal type C domain-containing protein [Flavobacterium gelatinilyticum]
MKKKLPALFNYPQILNLCFSLSNHSKNSLSKVKLSILFSFFCVSMWAQLPPHTFDANGTVVVPAGIISMEVEGWGAGGAGGGANNSVALTGRGGAGGGGGAYAHGFIGVTAGNTLNVRVAGATTGTTGSGVNGGNSYIEGFELAFLAAGGLGGIANTTGTSGGGTGGSASTSKGSITTVGGNDGGAGGNFLLNLGGASGAGGKAGGAAGGAGGASRTSALLGVGPGIAGTPPGGGGSGGLHLAGSAAQAGGDGAAGRVIVRYTCPTYGIGTLQSVPTCVSTATSNITFTSTAALLPTGVYNVTYNRSLPSGTALTATMTVSTAGTGFFTASGLTTAGTSVITVTNISSGVCSTPVSSANTINVTVSPSTVGGTVAGGTTICSGSTSAALSLTGQVGSIIRWESSVSPFSTWNPISNTTASYTSGALTQTTQFRAVIQSGTCSVVNSGATTVTVNPLPQGSLSANGPFCVTGAGQLTFNATAGTGPYTIVYTENGGTNRTVTGVTSGTPFNVFTTPVTTTTNYAIVSVTDANCTRSTGFTGGGTAAITVNPLPQGSLSAVSPLCGSGAGQLTFTASAGTGPYTIVYTENGGTNRTATGVVSGTAFTPFTTPVTGSTTYALVSVTGANSCVRSSGFTGSTAAITVNPLPQGSLTALSPLCGSGAGQLTFTASAGTGPYTIVYTENGGTNRTATGVVSGTAFAPFTTPVTATTNYAIVSVTDANCTRSTGFTGGGATITVNPLPQGSLTAVSPLCGSGAGQLTFTASSGTGPYTIVYTENGGTNRTATGVVSGTAFTPFTTPVTATTNYAIVSITDANCTRSTGFTGGGATITVNPLPQGSLSAVSPLCGSGAGQLTFTASAGTGPYTIVYTENGGTNRTATGVVSGTAFTPFTTPVTGSTTYALVSVTGANSCVRSSGFTSATAAITVNPVPVPTFTASPPASVCVSTDVTYTTQAGQTNYLWTIPGTSGTDYTITAGAASATSNTVTLQWLTTGNKTVTVGYSSSGCPSTVNASNTTAAIQTVKGAVNGGQHICIGSSSPLLTLSGYTGTIVRWEYAEAIPYVWQSIAHTGSTYQPGILTTSTSYRAVVKNGTCPEDYAVETRIDVDPRPSTPTVGTITQPSCVVPGGSVILNGLISPGSWTINQSGTAVQTYSSSGTTYTVSNLAPGNYTFTIQETGGCQSLPTVNVEIIAPVTNIWNGTSWSKGTPPVASDAIEFAGNYSTTGDLSGCSCKVDSGVTVIVNSNHTLTITNAVTNNGGTLQFENNASLLQVNNSVNSGNIIYKRKTAPIRRYDMTFWSSPIVRTPAYTLHDLSPETLADKYYAYDVSLGWAISYGGTVEMIPGHGYLVRAPQTFDIVNYAEYVASFIGVPNNGTIPIPLLASERYHMVGNPYPSAVYADQFIFDNQSNLYGSLYFWTHNTAPIANPGGGGSKYTNDDYAVYNLAGSVTVGAMQGTGAGSPGNQDPPSGYIAAGQSFFVKAKSVGTANFTNTMRVAGNNNQFFKTDQSNKSALERHRVWLNLTNTEGAFKQLLIGYIEGATNSWDNNYDAVTLNGNKFLDFYSVNENRKLVIQGRALPFDDSDVIQLGYSTTIEGEFSISIDRADGDLTNQNIYLEDKLTNSMHNLTASNYTFSTTIGTFLNRFLVRYKTNTLGVGDFENQNSGLLISVKDKIISLNASNDLIQEVSIYDVSGKLIYNTKKVEAPELQISDFKSADQVLLVKVTLNNGNTTTRKIVFY